MQNTENQIITNGVGLTGLTLAYSIKKAGKNIQQQYHGLILAGSIRDGIGISDR